MNRSLPGSRRTFPWYIAGAELSDENLEQRMNISFCVNIGRSTSETSALLTLVYGEHAMNKSSVFNVTDGSRKGERRSKMTQEVSSHKSKRQK
jgi:hypothetical protein